MKRFKNVVVYAGSNSLDDPALRRASVLAERNQAHLQLIDVVEQLPSYARMLAPAQWNVPELLAAEREKDLALSCESLKSRGISCEYKVLQGSSDLEITKHVIRTKADLVIKTARPEPKPSGQWYGNLARRLMRICPCPVWILKADQGSRFERIMASINPVDNDPQRAELSTKIIEMASSLAERENAELHIVHAWTAYGEHLLRSRMDAGQVAAYAEECQREAQRRVTEFLTRFDDKVQAAEVHLPKGYPEEALLKATTEQQCDLLVMGSVCRTGVSGYLIGNTAEEVLRHVPCAVLAVKPNSFRSPVNVESVPSEVSQA